MEAKNWTRVKGILEVISDAQYGLLYVIAVQKGSVTR